MNIYQFTAVSIKELCIRTPFTHSFPSKAIFSFVKRPTYIYTQLRRTKHNDFSPNIAYCTGHLNSEMKRKIR